MTRRSYEGLCTAETLRVERERKFRRDRVEREARRRAVQMGLLCAPWVAIVLMTVAAFAGSISPLVPSEYAILSVTGLASSAVPALLEYRRALLEAI